MRTSRLEAFSDGVIAIIITIMVLELPRPEGHDWRSLHAVWPTFLGYVLSFVLVGIYWNNHHHMLQAVRRINGTVMWMNLLLLFWLSLFPYVTGWAGESHFEAVPMTCYAVVALMCGVSFAALSMAAQACDQENHVLAEAVGAGIKERVSMAAYVVAVVAPFFGTWGRWVSGLVMVGVAISWIVPDRRVERLLSARSGESA